mmetsp:Transcript_2178/g.5799  ORF Transcript_2178/g.5799 Transcript_2178/m.5799 type:complete len:266 (+) Transcript_2178:71-868(+)
MTALEPVFHEKATGACRNPVVESENTRIGDGGGGGRQHGDKDNAKKKTAGVPADQKRGCVCGVLFSPAPPPPSPMTISTSSTAQRRERVSTTTSKPKPAETTTDPSRLRCDNLRRRLRLRLSDNGSSSRTASSASDYDNNNNNNDNNNNNNNDDDVDRNNNKDRPKQNPPSRRQAGIGDEPVVHFVSFRRNRRRPEKGSFPRAARNAAKNRRAAVCHPPTDERHGSKSNRNRIRARFFSVGGREMRVRSDPMMSVGPTRRRDDST